MPVKKCKCGAEFVQYTSFQRKCHKCLVEDGRKKIHMHEKREIREKKKKLRTRGWYEKGAQDAVNKCKRLLDRGKPCISCGRSDGEVENSDGWKTGGAWDAGHYLSVGSHPELRYCLLNIYRQCKSCNGGSGKYTRKNHTVSKAYRDNLISVVGLEVVEYLEGPHEPKKYTIEELEEIKRGFNAWARELENDT